MKHLILELKKIGVLWVLIFCMLVALTACNDAPHVECDADGQCKRNGFKVDSQNNYIGD